MRRQYTGLQIFHERCIGYDAAVEHVSPRVHRFVLRILAEGVQLRTHVLPLLANALDEPQQADVLALEEVIVATANACLLYTSPSPRD